MKRLLCLIVLTIIIHPIVCEEVGYIFRESGAYELKNATVSRYDASNAINLAAAVGPKGAGLRALSRRCSRVRIPSPALTIFIFAHSQ